MEKGGLMRVALAAGGSGGHLFPAISLAEELTKKARAEIMFIGTEAGLEARVVSKTGYAIKFLPAEGVLGRSAAGKLKALLKIASSFVKARGLLRSYQPDIVVGTGGYVSVGPVAAAWLLSIPTLIMEQNVVPGAANRFLAKLADAVCATYQESVKFFPTGKTYLTGNPVRAGLAGAQREDACGLFGLEPEGFTVFVFGGSSGSRSINNAIMNALNHMLDLRNGPGIQFLHQSGEQDYQGVREAYRRTGFRAMVAPFIYQMPEAYAVADLVVSRAGATTLAELTTLGKPALLIPYPYAGGHQEFNARKLEEFGAARLIREADLSGQALASELRRLMESESELKEMAVKSKSIGKPDAAQRVCDILLSIVKLRGAEKAGLGRRKGKNV